MRRFKYYLLGIPIMVLLFSFSVHATTSNTVVSLPITNASAGSIVCTTYPNLDGILIDAEDIQGTSQAFWKFEPNFAIDLANLPSGFINGFLIFDITITNGLTNGTYSSWEVMNLAESDSIHASVTYVRNNVFRVLVYLDNYNDSYGPSHLGDLKITYQDKSTAYSATNATSFNASVSIINNRLVKSDVVQNDRLSAILYSAITQATGQELANIISGLAAIQNQDYIYYQQLVSQIASLTQAQNTANADLLLILNELDLDFQQVQTVLDLFPSYRTQVLQYWQQLLEMNASQSSAAAEIESQYADRDNQSSQLINGMGSVVMPSISSNDLNILGDVDADQKANFFGIIALITHNELVTKIMLIIVLGAIVGYILYGKK